jgi:hypothetical protein
MSALRGVLLTALCLLAVANLASADVNPTPIAVPLIGDQGVGSPYPSRIDLVARGGPDSKRVFTVVLHAVTHPCPEPIPDSEPATPPYPSQAIVAPSSYGSTPAFPAPAPGGPYDTDLPTTADVIEGTWDLYVVDTGSGHRGVIAGGWSIHYDTSLGVSATEASAFPVHVPAGPPSVTKGPAAVYPMTFDYSEVPAGVKVFDTFLTIGVSHAFPADLTVILQAPSGESVLVMSNAGGGNALSNVTIAFSDQATSVLPQSTPIPSGTYLSASPHSATWRTQIGGSGYYASGLMTQAPGSDLVSADIPMKRGTNPTNFGWNAGGEVWAAGTGTVGIPIPPPD